MNKKITALIIALLFTFNLTTFADSSSLTNTNSLVEDKKIDSNYYIAPQNNVEYSFKDEEAIKKNFNDSKNILVKLKCDSKSLMSKLGINNGENITNITIKSGSGFYYNFDLVNCSLNLSRNYYNNYYGTSQITEEAKEKLKDFLATDKILNKIYNMDYNKFIISSKDNNNGNVGIYKVSDVSKNYEDENNNIIIEEDNSGNDYIDQKYNSITFLQPLILNGLDVYTQYGEKVGLSITIDSNGVSYANLNLIQVKGSLKDSDKITYDEFKNISLNGGNSPYYNNYGDTKTKVEFNSISKILILGYISDNIGNTNTYISSGLRLESSSKNTYEQNGSYNYNQFISKFKILNNGNKVYY